MITHSNSAIRLEDKDIIKGRVVFPENIVYIRDFFARNASFMKELIFPKNTEIIAQGVACRCNNLEKIVIPEGVKYINSDFANDNPSLKKITIPKSVKIIESWFCYHCETLEEITIPENVIIEGSTFAQACGSLKKIKILKNKTNKMKKQTEFNVVHYDGIAFAVVTEKTKGKLKIFTGYFVNTFQRRELKYLIVDGDYSAHGDTLKAASENLIFKIAREKVKKDPIYKDTPITVEYYQMLTGACNPGVKNWLDSHKIKYKEIPVEGKQSIIKELKPMKAIDVYKLLEKDNSFGFTLFKSLLAD